MWLQHLQQVSDKSYECVAGAAVVAVSKHSMPIYTAYATTSPFHPCRGGAPYRDPDQFPLVLTNADSQWVHSITKLLNNEEEDPIPDEVGT